MTVIARLIAAGLLVALGACNTVEGFGRDVKGGGEAITGAAKDVQDQL
jgi:predicted small secreted protein